MMEFSHLTVIVFSELMLGLLIVSGILLTQRIHRGGKIRAAAQQLSARVRSDKDSRSERLKNLLEQYYGYEGQPLNQLVHDLSMTEMRLYQNIINGYLQQDEVALKQIDIDVENLVIAYQELELPQVEGKAAADTDDDGIKHLEDENKRLSDDLRLTMDAMGRMLDKYAAMQDCTAINSPGMGDEVALAEGGEAPLSDDESAALTVATEEEAGAEMEDETIPAESLPGEEAKTDDVELALEVVELEEDDFLVEERG